MRKLVLLIPLLISLSAMMPVLAEEVSEADKARILSALPELAGSTVQPSPIEGMYEVMFSGQILYVSEDGQYLLQGDLFDVVKEVNVTEERRQTLRQLAVAEVNEADMIVFSPEEVKHTVTVFTDIDCGYCRKLHREMSGYNERGIEVRYMSFPRNGPDTAGWFKAENVWCSKDRNDALTRAKAGEEVLVDECESIVTVTDQYNLGRTLGIRGTPAIILENGQLLPGYVAPNELLGYLED